LPPRWAKSCASVAVRLQTPSGKEATMAKVANAYADNCGVLHTTPHDAAVADLTTVLGRIGAEAGITAGLARMIIEKRPEIETVFADLDLMRAHDERTS